MQHAGNISHQEALDKAHTEYEKYKERTQNDLSEGEKHFIKEIENTAKKLKLKSTNNENRTKKDNR